MPTSSPNDLSISAVERETGLSKDTLRMWERRYNFPAPGRDESGERIYPPEQVDKLRLIKKLMDHGHRPGKLVAADMTALRDMARQQSGGEATHAGMQEERQDLLHYVALCKEHRMQALQRELTQCLLRTGIYRFAIDVLAPLTVLIGERWASGHLAVFEEHLYTEAVQSVMRNAIGAIPTADSGAPARPRIVLTTIPHEPHGLGLLMCEAIFALEGAHCISLGVQTPISEIAQAAAAQAADIVALSFSASARPAQVIQALTDLHAQLPPAVEIWGGGRCPVLARRPPAAIEVLELHEIPGALTQWRRRRMA